MTHDKAHWHRPLAHEDSNEGHDDECECRLCEKDRRQAAIDATGECEKCHGPVGLEGEDGLYCFACVVKRGEERQAAYERYLDGDDDHIDRDEKEVA